MHASQKVEVILSKDGSHTLFVPGLNETYHSINGAIVESEYVYIQNGLDKIRKYGLINILEIGFGTGLNALLTAIKAEKHLKQIKYHTLEPFPIGSQVYDKLNYPSGNFEINLFRQLHECEWENEVEISATFHFKKILEKLESIDLEFNHYDLVYYDAFAPSKQPEIWNYDLLEKIYHSMNEGSHLVTYCSQGQFQRNLSSIGFVVETLEGPPGKFEMVRATKY